MIKIASAVEAIVTQNPLYYEIVASRIANFSRLAQIIKSEVEDRTQKSVKTATIVVNLTRLASTLARKESYLKLCRQSLIDYRIKLPIVEFVLDKSERNLAALAGLERQPEEFFSLAQGQNEINIVCSPFYAGSIEKALTVKRRLDNLVLVSIRFEAKLVKTPGLFYYLSSLMFAHGINIVDVISTYTELNLLINPRDIQTATQILGDVFRTSGRS